MFGILRLTGIALSMALATNAMAAAVPSTGGLPPWHFEMTPQEVKAFTNYGPYKSFGNGDLETYAGLFDGRKENVQFFFKDGKLARIGVYLYEGQDIKAAADVWGKTYKSLKEKFGEIELPDIRVVSGDAALTAEVVAAAAGANVSATGKSQMAPRKQTSDVFLFASFRREEVMGQPFYYVTVYYDPPRR
ncbi:hypothetical protein [Dyella sp. 20L07]|uniref:hypothetical protein n=1 Tax=Dyella sp. 20L07 TaxID=3384240 RepID=UPI003D2BBCF3